METSKSHYGEAYADVMNDPNRHTKEDKEKWMSENRARFDAA